MEVARSVLLKLSTSPDWNCFSSPLRAGRIGTGTIATPERIRRPYFLRSLHQPLLSIYSTPRLPKIIGRFLIVLSAVVLSRRGAFRSRKPTFDDRALAFGSDRRSLRHHAIRKDIVSFSHPFSPSSRENILRRRRIGMVPGCFNRRAAN